MRVLSILVWVLVWISIVRRSNSDHPTADCAFHKYVIVGAGPGGLQLGHFLESAGRDYVILEASPNAASFFDKYPRFKKLISVNKRFVGTDHLDFNLRHDWNSLLAEPSHRSRKARERHAEGLANGTFSPSWTSPAASLLDRRFVSDERLLFRNWSHDYYPSRADLQSYMQWWAQNAQLNIRYNTTVVDIQSSRRQFSDEQDQSRLSQNVPRFTIEMRVNGSAQNHNKRRLCLSARVLVLATGLEPQHQSGDPLDFDPFPVANLDELAETYSHFDTDLSQFEGKRVVILGQGNSGFEIASNIMHVTHSTSLLGLRRAGPNITSDLISDGQFRLAWRTHYPGDTRAVYNNILESYQLKTLDVVATATADELALQNHSKSRRLFRTSVFRDSATKLLHFVFQKHRPAHNTGETDFDSLSPRDEATLRRCLIHLQGVLSKRLGVNVSINDAANEYDRLWQTPPLEDNPLHNVACGRFRFSQPGFHRAILSTGWRAHLPPFSFELRTRLWLTEDGTRRGEKYPPMNEHFAHPNISGLFFAGAIMHANDYRKAAGGFIHGFRYLVRSLHRVLEIEEETITPHVHTLSSRDSNAHTPTEMPSTAQWPISLVSSALVARQGAPDDAAARNTCHELSKTTETQFGTPGCPLGDENPIVTSIPKPWVNSVASALNQVVTAVVTKFLFRANHGSGIYQMFGQLGDVIVFETFNASSSGASSSEPAEFCLVASYFEEVPMSANFTSLLGGAHLSFRGSATTPTPCGGRNTTSNRNVILASLEYGRTSTDRFEDPFGSNRVADPQHPETSKFLHPVLRVVGHEDKLAKNASEVHLVEDVHGHFTDPEHHVKRAHCFFQDQALQLMANAIGLHIAHPVPRSVDEVAKSHERDRYVPSPSELEDMALFQSSVTDAVQTVKSRFKDGVEVCGVRSTEPPFREISFFLSFRHDRGGNRLISCDEHCKSMEALLTVVPDVRTSCERACFASTPRDSRCQCDKSSNMAKQLCSLEEVDSMDHAHNVSQICHCVASLPQ